MNLRFLRRAKVCAGIALAVAIFGCGGAGANLINALIGNYTGSGTLNSGKTGALSYTINADGTVAGSYTVSGTEGPFAGYNFLLGTYDLSGLIDALGHLHLQGNIPGEGDFEIEGDTPQGGNSSGYTVGAGGSTYTGTMEKEPETSTASLLFSDLRTTNCPGVDFASNMTINVGDDSGHLNTVVQDNPPGVRQLSIHLYPEYTTGTFASLAGTIEPKALVFYSETIGGQICNWIAKSGTVRIISRNGNKVELKLEDAFFGPTFNPGMASGTFVINGTVKN